MFHIKLYCYVDETGQDTGGKFFLVSAVLIEKSLRDKLEQRLEEIERKTGKKKAKWIKTDFSIRKEFLKEVAYITNLQSSIMYATYAETKTYIELTALTIAKAVLAKGEEDYDVTIIVDGLTKADTEKIRKELKKLRVKYDTIRGMRDEQSVFLRLADCIAGFMRDYIEKQLYTEDLFTLLTDKKILIEI